MAVAHGASDYQAMKELLNKLTEKEQQLLVAQQIAKARVDEMKQQVSDTAADMMQRKRALEQERIERLAANSKMLRDTALSCHQEVMKAQERRRQAEAEADRARFRQKNAEERVAALKAKLSGLDDLLRKRTENGESDFSAVQKAEKARLARIGNECSWRVDNMTSHARSVEAACHSSLIEVQQELRSQLAFAHVRAESRGRWKELCDLAESWLRAEMSRATYEQVKGELLNLWKVQNGSHTPRPASSASAKSPLPALTP